LSVEEIVKLRGQLVKDGYESVWKRDYRDDWSHGMFHAWVFGGSIEGFIDTGYKGYYPKDLKDIRLVFWFDN